MYFSVLSVGGSTVKHYNLSVIKSDSNLSYSLFHFSDSNKALDYNQDNSSPAQRKEMFDSVDTHRHNSINFEEYLQVVIKKTIEATFHNDFTETFREVYFIMTPIFDEGYEKISIPWYT